MRQFALRLALVLALGVVQGGPASAGNEWCSQDPVIQLLGSQFHVTTSVAASAWTVDQIAYRIEVPANATDAVAHFSQGKRLPSTVEFVHTGDPHDGTSATFAVRITVFVTAASASDIFVKVSGRSVAAATHSGQAGSSLSFPLTVAAR